MNSFYHGFFKTNINRIVSFNMNLPVRLLFFALAMALFSCGDENSPVDPPEEFVPELSVTPLNLSFGQDGGTESISISSNTIWNVSSSTSWCTSTVQTSKGDASININAVANDVEEERSSTITIRATDVEDIIVSVIQEAKDREPVDTTNPEYIEPDITGMSSDALVLASKMTVGWNLVNTLEAIGGETAWGNPKANNDLILAVKNAGFNAIRIPCSWNQYLDDPETYKIKDSWMERVQEVVDYCIDNDMYAILNIHWDGGWMENNVTPDKQEEVNNKLEIIWKQIAVHFRDYDERLLFAGANEPNADNQEKVDVLNVYMQTFVDAVRSTGGRNSYRNLIIQAPNTDVNLADTYMTLPEDEVENRLFAEVHYYSPWNFCGLEEDASWGKMFYFWGQPNHVEGAGDRNASWGEEDFVLDQFAKMKSKFVDQGIPMILGEYGAVTRDLSRYEEGWQQKHDESRAYFYETVTRESKNNGLIPFCWDNSIFNRYNYTISDTLSYQGLINGSENGMYPF